MIKERKKNRKLHGSVLLTVVCVMSILIVFLFGTLVLATAANNRAHVNYSSAQTAVTSRTVVDAAIKAMEANKDYAKVISEISAEKTSSPKIPVKLGSTVANAGRYGNTDDHGILSYVNADYAGSKKFYNDATKEWVDGTIIKFTASVSMAGVDSTTSAYIVKQNPGDNPPAAGNGAGFVTTAGAELTCQTNLYGGAYLGLPRMEKNLSGVYLEVTNISPRVYRTEYNYNDPSTYRNFDEHGNPVKYTLDKSGAWAECDLYVNGGLDVHDWTGIIFPAAGKGITVWGDMTFGNSGTRYMRGPGYDTSKDLNFNDIAYVFVDGKISATNHLDLGNTSDPFPLNVFCGSIDTTCNGYNIAADVYCMDADKTSKFGANNLTSLYAWSNSVVNSLDPIAPEAKTHGSIYSKGNVILEKINVEGDVRVAGNCTIGQNTIINGDLVVGGELTINSGAKLTVVNGDIYCNAGSFKNNGTLDKESNFKKVDTIDNPPDTTGAVEIENTKRYYFEVPLTDAGYNWYENTDLGVRIYSSSHQLEKVYYKWNEDFDPALLGIADDPAIYNDRVRFNMETTGNRDVTEFLDLSMPNDNFDWMTYPYCVTNDGIDKRPGNDVDGDPAYYFVENNYDEVVGDFHAASVPTNEEKYLVDPATNQRFTNFRTVPDIDGNQLDPPEKMSDSKYSTLGYAADDTVVWYNKKTGEIASKAQGMESELGYSALPIEDYIDENIYPEYAEKLVVIGEEQILKASSEFSKDELKVKAAQLKNEIRALRAAGASEDEIKAKQNEYDAMHYPKSQTQIVKSMADVVENVANPYDFAELSDTLVAVYDKIKADDDVTYHSVDDIIAKNKKYVSEVHADGTYKLADAFNGEGHKKYDQNNLNGVYINESCVLDGASFGEGYARNRQKLLINPGSGELLVVIRNSVFLSGKWDIMVDDSQGGTVSIFIENGSELKTDSTCMSSSSYMKAFSENKGKIWFYNTSKFLDADGKAVAGTFDLSKLGRPHLNIYGATGSKLSSSNYNYMVANILSPNLAVDITSTDSKKHQEDYNFSQMWYNDINIYNPDGKEVKEYKNYVFGCLNSRETKVPNIVNVLYVTDGSDDVKHVGDGDDAFEYRVLYYDEY